MVAEKTKKKGGVMSKADRYAGKQTDELLRCAMMRLEQGAEDMGHVAKLRNAALEHVTMGTPDDLEAAERCRYKARFQLEQIETSIRMAIDEISILKSRDLDKK